MPTIYTIGYKGKSLETFINQLRDASIDAVIDVRLRNTSHLAGYTKNDTLSFLLREGFGIAYEHHPQLAPTLEIFDAHREHEDWAIYESLFVPILAGQYTDAECNGRHVTLIAGKEYGECSFCRAACPSRDLFIEPDADIPLKCDMCGEPPPLEGPSCVRVCLYDALVYVEREVEG